MGYRLESAVYMMDNYNKRLAVFEVSLVREFEEENVRPGRLQQARLLFKNKKNNTIHLQSY